MKLGHTGVRIDVGGKEMSNVGTEKENVHNKKCLGKKQNKKQKKRYGES